MKPNGTKIINRGYGRQAATKCSAALHSALLIFHACCETSFGGFPTFEFGFIFSAAIGITNSLLML